MINPELTQGFFCYYHIPTVVEKLIGPFAHKHEADSEVFDVSFEGVTAMTVYLVRCEDGTWSEPNSTWPRLRLEAA